MRPMTRSTMEPTRSKSDTLGMVQASGAEVPARIDGSGQQRAAVSAGMPTAPRDAGRGPVRLRTAGARDPRSRDVLNLAAAAAHADVDPDDQVATERRGKSRRTWSRARLEGPREIRAFQTYLFESPEPFRLEAHVKSLVKQIAIRKLSREQLIERFHELRAREKTAEGADNAQDVTPAVAWLDRAAAKERDAAVDEELAAVMREFAARGITEAEVLGR